MLNAPIPLLLTITLTVALIVNVIRKYYTKNVGSTVTHVFLFGSAVSGVSAITLLFWGGFGTASRFTVILAIIFGLISAVQNLTNLKAFSTGPMSYTTIIISFSTLISTLSGVLFFGEDMKAAHIVGIVLMLISFLLAVEKKSDEGGFSAKWLVLCTVTFLMTGAIGVMQKIHQHSEHRAELNSFLIIAFCVAFIVPLVLAPVFAKKEQVRLGISICGVKHAFILLVALLIIGGVCIAANNKLNLFLSGAMESAIFFPVMNGGTLMLTTLGALLIFKERLSKRQTIGLVGGIVSLIAICLVP